MKRFFTSESVTEGHPDKICDKTADSILDAVLTQDSKSRVACEVVATTDYMLIMGEINSKAKVNFEDIARNTIKDIGYTDDALGFNYKTAKIDIRLHNQSPDIAMGVSRADNTLGSQSVQIGAGDQGMMFGYACDETVNFMPLSISLAHNLAKSLTHVRKSGEIGYLRPDGKTQVTVEYRNDIPFRVDTVVISAQHSPEVEYKTIRKDLIKSVIKPQLGNLMDSDTKILINTTGQFCIGGPHGDSGLTGRKIIVDTYGGHCAHGGGAFSGKDATKVDRSAAYMARYICKNIVAAKLATKCELQISYAIGVSQPTSVFCNTHRTGKISDDKLRDMVLSMFDLRPQAIIEKLELTKPIYALTSVYGHFGINGVTWESLDMVDSLQRQL
ncbi:MAG: methionine adenosyltransferase [Clostridiales bacterium]|jgi:S-adenosylmethionine synthetase|nr:methionine adenosyltransferase [Clostridiales bacterium]